MFVPEVWCAWQIHYDAAFKTFEKEYCVYQDDSVMFIEFLLLCFQISKQLNFASHDSINVKYAMWVTEALVKREIELLILME